jgi:hypothetical protein
MPFGMNGRFAPEAVVPCRSRRVLGRGSFYSDSTQRYRGKISERNWRPVSVGPKVGKGVPVASSTRLVRRHRRRSMTPSRSAPVRRTAATIRVQMEGVNNFRSRPQLQHDQSIQRVSSQALRATRSDWRQAVQAALGPRRIGRDVRRCSSADETGFPGPDAVRPRSRSAGRTCRD